MKMSSLVKPCAGYLRSDFISRDRVRHGSLPSDRPDGFQWCLHPGPTADFSHRYDARSSYMKMDATAFVADPELVDALRQHSDSVACVEDRVLFNQGDAPNGLYIFL